MIALRAGALIDGTGSGAYGPAIIVVDNGRITAVGPAETVAVPLEVKVLPLDHLTLTPGLVDAHTHFGFEFQGTSTHRLSNYQLLLRGAKCAREDLLSGVTTARTMGERDFLDVAYRDALQKGWIDGPRTVIATRGIQPSHSRTSASDVYADGVDAVRRVIRENLLAGADVIKLLLTPSPAKPKPIATQAYYTQEEVNAAVDEAHRAGKLVGAHALGEEVVAQALEAGVDSIEHGLWAGRDQLQRMAEKGTWLVATQTLWFWGDDPRLARGQEATRRVVAEAREASVRLAVGTDGAHGKMYYELECLVRAGCTPMEALIAGTRDGAAALGLAGKTGTLEVGKWADLLGVAGDPLADIGAMEDVSFVMKEGVVCFSEATPADRG